MVDQIERLDVRAENNVSAAMDAAAASLNNVADAADKVTVVTEAAGKSATSFARKNDDVTKAAAALGRAVKEQADQLKAFAAASAAGTADADAFARANDTVAAKVEAAKIKLADLRAAADLAGGGLNGAGQAAKTAAGLQAEHEKAVKGGQMALRDLAMQSQDFFVQVTSGQGIFRPLLQQGSQVYQQLQASGQGFGALKQAAVTAIGAILSPLGLFVSGLALVVGGLGAMTLAGNSQLGALGDLRSGLRATHDDYADLAKMAVSAAHDISATSGLGLSEAIGVAKTLVAGRYFTGTAADIKALAHEADDLGMVMGGGAAAGAKTLAEGMENPAKTAEALSASFKGLTPQVREHIANLQAAGHQSEAFAALQAVLIKATKGAADDGISPMAKAWRDLGNAFTGSTSGWDPFMQALAKGAADTIANTTKEVKGLTEAFHMLQSAWSSVPGRVTAFANSGGVDNDGMPVGSATGQAAQVQAPVLTSSATKDAFIATWMDAAKQAGAALGVSPTSILGQWGAESGWGKSVYNNNLGNIKAQDGYAGSSFQNPGDHLSYRAYATPTDAVADFIKVLQTDRYAAARNTGDDARAYATGLKKGGYAENPDYVNLVTNAAASVGGAGSVAGATPAKAAADLAALTEQTKAYTDATREATGTTLRAQMEGFVTLRNHEAETNGTGTAEYARLTQAMEKNQAAQHANVDAIEASQRASDSALRASKGQTAAEQGLAAAIEQRSQIAKNAGMAFTDADKSQATNNYLLAQSQEYGRLTAAMKLASDQQDGMTSAYDRGNQAVLDTTAKQAAYNEAIKIFPRDWPLFDAALNQMTEAYQRAATAASNAKTAQENAGSRDQLAYIQAETGLISANDSVRTVALATMTAEQEMHRRYGDILPAEAQAYVTLKGAVASATAEFQHQQATLNEVSGFFTSTFDTISTAITQAFATGQLQALKFGDIMKSVASSVVAEFAKLAVLNPLKNMLFGGNATTLTDVGGLIGGLFGGGAASATTGAAGAANAVFGGAGGVIGAAGGATGVAGASGMLGSLFNGPIGSVLTIGKAALSWFTGGGATAAEAANAVFGGAGGVVGGAGGAATGFAGTAGSIASTLGASDAVVGAVTSAASTVASALPAIGAAISVVTDLLTGNYRGAGLVAAGALIGSAILPGIGTAVGAAVGTLVDMFLPKHPLHPFEDVELNVAGGKLVTGKSDGQLADVAGLVSATQSYADGVNKYLDSVGVRISNADVNIARVGQGITGLAQTLDPNTAFHRLTFANADPNDRSNFGVAKGALDGMSFDNPQALADELAKIAGFADAASTLGIQLAYVGKDISNIRVASVDTGALTATGDTRHIEDEEPRTTTIKGTDGAAVSFLSDLRIALNADLPNQNFVDVGALDAEIGKVAAFFTTTIPALLTPTKATQSTAMDQYNAVHNQYDVAAQQSKNYGLDNTAVIAAAQTKALEIVMEPYTRALATATTAISGRYATAANGAAGASSAGMANLAMTQANDRAALDDQWRQTWGDSVVLNSAYNASMRQLIETQKLETQAAQHAADVTYTTAAAGVAASAADFAKRSGGDTQGTALAAFDANAAAEKATFIKTWTDFYGQAITSADWFQSELSQVDSAHYKERLALQAQYVSAQSIADRNAAGQAVVSLTKYAQSLQTGGSSALSAQDQYSLAGRQFDAVSGSAAAGDYNSVSSLQGYADSFLATSRTVNGSGAAYANDFNKVLTALGKVGNTSADMLTGAYMASIAQSQTDQLLAELQALRSAVNALQAQAGQFANTPARVAV